LFYDSGKASYGKAGEKWFCRTEKTPKIMYKTTKNEVKFMGRKEARAKAWNTFRKSIYKHAESDSNFSIQEFELQRLDTSYRSWRDARDAERAKNFKRARDCWLKSVESLEQFEKLENIPALTEDLNRLKAEYEAFVFYRDPEYRAILKYILPIVRKSDGILQTEVYKFETANCKKADMTYALYFAEKERLIRREQKGRSYRLYFLKEKADDAPQSIQNDEIDIQREAEARSGCLFFLALLAWVFAFVAAGGFVGPVGAGLVVAAYVVWRIIKRNLRKKRERDAAA
jgi:hypothetical protein